MILRRRKGGLRRFRGGLRRCAVHGLFFKKKPAQEHPAQNDQNQQNKHSKKQRFFFSLHFAQPFQKRIHPLLSFFPNINRFLV